MDYNYSGVESVLGAFLAFLGIIIVIGLAVGIIMIIARWKLFVKSGEEGWKAIIPIYGDMVLCKIVGIWEFYPLVIYGISFVMGFISGVSESLGGLLSLVSYAASIYYSVILCISLARSYGKDTGFGIGLLFLGVIFYPILGFGKNEYAGPKPMKDPIFGSLAANQAAPAPQAAPAAATGGNFCPQCGASNPADSGFCQKCGNKLN